MTSSPHPRPPEPLAWWPLGLLCAFCAGVAFGCTLISGALPW